MKTKTVSILLALAVASAALAIYAGYEQEAVSQKTEEIPVCTKNNNGISCQRRICTRVDCYTGESSCTPTGWECGPWESGTCKAGPFGLWHYCSI